MEREEFIRRCEEVIKQYPNDVFSIAGKFMGGLEYELYDWNANGQKNKEEVERSIGKVYIALMLLQIHFCADADIIEYEINKVLQMT